MSAGRIDAVTASYYRNGLCEVCGKWAERQTTFTAVSLSWCNRMAAEWESRPIRHRRCEHLTPPP